MDIVPLIRFRNRNILGKEDSKYKIDEFLKNEELPKKIYLLDYDGIEKNKPNLCTYQKLSKTIDLWVDAGPNDIGDVVDAVMAGATDITLRKQLWPNINLEKIREITEINLYLELCLKKQDKYNTKYFLLGGIEGLVVLDNVKEKNTSTELIKNLAQKHKIYIYETDQRNIDHWEALGVYGLLVNLDDLGAFKKHDR
jgi:hypothetical protein